MGHSKCISEGEGISKSESPRQHQSSGTAWMCMFTCESDYVHLCIFCIYINNSMMTQGSLLSTDLSFVAEWLKIGAKHLSDGCTSPAYSEGLN